MSIRLSFHQIPSQPGSFGAEGADAGSSCTGGTCVGGACIGGACIRGACVGGAFVGSVGAVECLEIHLRSFRILEVWPFGTRWSSIDVLSSRYGFIDLLLKLGSGAGAG